MYNLAYVKDEDRFYRFMVACAACSGQLFNASDIGDATDADRKTVESWLPILQASGLVCVVRPFWTNVEKRLTKTLKICFMDTGFVTASSAEPPRSSSGAVQRLNQSLDLSRG